MSQETSKFEKLDRERYEKLASEVLGAVLAKTIRAKRVEISVDMGEPYNEGSDAYALEYFVAYLKDLKVQVLQEVVRELDASEEEKRQFLERVHKRAQGFGMP